jgi:glucosylceramidase
MHDDQRNSLVKRTDTVLGDPEAAKFVSGVGFHWYSSVEDTFPQFSHVQSASQKYQDQFFFGTEACEGYLPWKRGPLLGDWKRGETYAHDILGDLNAGAGGWTDWNIVVNTQGGPNHANNWVDAPIIADTNNKTYFYKQPMYYYLGHFTKFITPESTRVHTTATGSGVLPALENVAFLTPDKKVVLVVLNRDLTSRTYWIHHPTSKGYINTNIQAHTIQTFIFNP